MGWWMQRRVPGRRAQARPCPACPIIVGSAPRRRHGENSPIAARVAFLRCAHDAARPPASPVGKLWWEIETWARQRIDRPLTLPELCAQSGRSPNTLARACREAVGLAPMKRLKQIRLSLARGLVLYSDLNMTEIAGGASSGGATISMG